MPKMINPDEVNWSRTRKGRHNWAELLDGNARELVQGEDFTSTPESMRAGALAQVKNFPKVSHVRTKIDPVAKKLYLHAILHESTPAEDAAPAGEQAPAEDAAE